MKYSFYLFLLFIIFSCENPNGTANQEERVVDTNPAAKGFNLEGSDEKAMEIADTVMAAMGGRKAWDDTRYISWNFFGSRKLLWDKWTGNVRIEFLKSDLKILVNIHELTGRVYKNDSEMTQSDSIDFYLKRGKSVWINDSYWLVMPYKLKDSGVTLTYLEEDITEAGAKADVLKLAFEKVGDTPENLYKIWIDKQNKLVTQWAFYRNEETEEPNFITPWEGYKKYGSILLSGDRGRGQLTEIEVLETVPEDRFKVF